MIYFRQLIVYTCTKQHQRSITILLLSQCPLYKTLYHINSFITFSFGEIFFATLLPLSHSSFYNTAPFKIYCSSHYPHCYIALFITFPLTQHFLYRTAPFIIDFLCHATPFIKSPFLSHSQYLLSFYSLYHITPFITLLPRPQVVRLTNTIARQTHTSYRFLPHCLRQSSGFLITGIIMCPLLTV